MSKNLPGILKKDEVAAYLRCSKRSVDYLVASREIPFVKTGKRSIRFSRGSLEKWIARREEGGDCQ